MTQSNVIHMTERERRKKIVDMLTSARGGFTRKALAELGIPWPPPKGWKKRLLGELPPEERKQAKPPKKKAKQKKPRSFYRTREWAQLRYKALKVNGGRCELCGRTADDGVVMQVDHIKPISTHPDLKSQISNLQVLCSTCNWGKGATDDTDWREPDVRALMGEAIH